jgi:MSHA biogenesis protein MshP
MLIIPHKSHCLKKQQGSSLVVAIFVITIISLLSVALASLQRDSAQSTSYEVYASRAYLSAYSAGELALITLFPLDSSDVDITNCTGEDISVDLGVDVGFHGCTASYQCQVLTSSDSTSLATRYKVTSTAVCENSQIVTRRQITLEAVSL